MRDELRWAARYQFLDSLWRGRDRLILDRALERALGLGNGPFGPEAEGPALDLVDALLPDEEGRDQVTVVVERGRRAADYARRRGGCTFVALDEATAVADEEPWSVAMVDLDGLVEAVAQDLETDEDFELPVGVSTFLEALAEHQTEDRDVVLSTRGGEGGLEVDAFVALVLMYFPGAKIYGLSWPAVAAVYDFGDVELDDDEGDDEEGDEGGDEDAAAEADVAALDGVALHAEGADPAEITETLVDQSFDEGARYDAELDAAEAAWSEDTPTEVFRPRPADEEDDEDDGPAALEVDTSLGADEPRVFEWIAVVSDKQLTDALTYVELWEANPPGAGQAEEHGSTMNAGAELSGLRAELDEARRQADLLAIDRQRLMEQLDEAESALAARVEDDALSSTGGRGAVGERLEVALAREQSLRWEVSRLSQEVEALRARPVEALEAEVARLEAELESVRSVAEQLAAQLESQTGTAQADGATAEVGLPSPELTQARRTALGQVEKLTRRVERGGLSSLELHRALRRIRDVLGRTR